MYAIIESCGRQYKVAKGDIVFFEKLDADEGKEIIFENILLLAEDKKIQVGNPYVKDVKVVGKVISHGKHKKIIVFKMKAKKNERKKQGHRQPYTKIEITEITTPEIKTNKKAEKEIKAEKTETEVKPETKTTTKKDDKAEIAKTEK